ncbi:MAG: hypothetical protein DRP65_00160 [Planctomycetota bacterium]|nr:MAG: hypothetical protein DRP65_00160 [Planctomycetota bacterium]
MKRLTNLITGRALLIVVLGILIVFPSGCSKKRSEAKEIKIGVLMPLTGDAASIGVPAWNGIQLAIEQINSRRNSEEPLLELVSEDTKALPAEGLSALQKLISIEKLKFVIGPLTSTVTLAVAPLAEQKKVVIISPGASAPKISESGDYIFRSEISEKLGGAIQATMAVNKLAYRRVACVYINTDYGAGLFGVFKKSFEQGGGSVVLSEAFDQGETDFRAIISKIKSEEVDAVFLVAIDEVINFVRQKKELGLVAQIYTTPIFENKLYLEKLGELAEGIVYVYYGTYNPESQDDRTISFVRAYESRFNSAPTYYSANAYDAAYMLYTALKESKYQLKTVKDALYNIKNFEGVSGTMSFDSNGDVTKDVSLKTVENGTFQFYKNVR